MITTILGYLATAVALTGSYLNARLIRCSFLLWIFSNIVFGIIDFSLGQHYRLFLDFVQLCTAVYGYVYWRKK
nr:MAG TPA: Nicotinamide mononucleotide transporter [Caudoviricetes sp.]